MWSLIALQLLVMSSGMSWRELIMAEGRNIAADTEIREVVGLPKTAPPTKTTRVKVVPLATQLVGHVPADIQVIQNDQVISHFPVILILRVERSLVCAKHDIPVGAIVEAKDVELRRIELMPDAPLGLSQLDVVIGQRVIKPILTGQMLTDQSLAKPTVINAKQHVTLVARQRGISASVPAETYQAGAVGDSIRVLNTLSNRVVLARVINAETVEAE